MFMDSPLHPGARAHRAARAGHGFSLVEVLVVIGVIGLLVALLLPALAGVRARARGTQSLVNLRTVYQVVDHYQAENRDCYPVSEPGQFYPYPCSEVLISFDYWAMNTCWPAVVADVAPWREFGRSFLSPGARRDLDADGGTCGWPTSYEYSRTFIARPETWREGATADPSFLAGVFSHDVRFPSKKTLAWDSEMPYLHREVARKGPDIAEPAPMLFADSHARPATPSQATAPRPNPFLPSSGDPQRIHNTADGVRSWDY